MKRPYISIAIALLNIVIVIGCSQSPTEPVAVVIEEDGKIFIVDQTLTKWDVTHAKEKYGMEPSKFQFGLGPNAIRPILNPKMLSPGDARYPSDNETSLILGTKLNDDTRAYPISVMSHFEIADEKFGDSHVAVAY